MPYPNGALFGSRRRWTAAEITLRKRWVRQNILSAEAGSGSVFSSCIMMNRLDIGCVAGILLCLDMPEVRRLRWLAIPVNLDAQSC